MKTVSTILSVHDSVQKISTNGVEIFFKANAEDTNGHWSMIEYHLPATEWSPPPHYHKKMQEAFYILEGALEFKLNDQSLRAEKGALVMIPELTVHSFKNGGDEKAKFLVWFSPGGFEGYFWEIQDLLKKSKTWPPEDPGLIFSMMAKYDTYPPEN